MLLLHAAQPSLAWVPASESEWRKWRKWRNRIIYFLASQPAYRRKACLGVGIADERRVYVYQHRLKERETIIKRQNPGERPFDASFITLS